MRSSYPRFLTALFAAIATADAVPIAPVGVVSHISVLSDKVPDVSSIEAWKKSFIRDGMSDEEKAMAVWKSVATFQFQDSPPKEYLQAEDLVFDPIKMFNVYGYSFCSVASSESACLARFAGLQARCWTINGHVVPELFFGGSWHLLDSSLITYFPKANGPPASVEEIIGGVKNWLAEHPDLKSNNGKLDGFMRGGGWRKGPDVLARCPLYDDNGWLPATTHGWSSTMQEYNGSTFSPYEPGHSQGYEVNIQLRHGERLTRNWSNIGLHVNKDEGDHPGALTQKVGEDQLRYSPKFGDLANGRIGNGTLEYEPQLANGGIFIDTLEADNLATMVESRVGPNVHVKDPARPGSFILRMPCSYVYLAGELTAKAIIGNGGGIDVLFSDNNGLDWRDLVKITASGEQRIDLKPFVFRRYDYRLKFTFKGAGTGLDSLRLVHTIQHSQRPLPALAAGANTISFNTPRADEGTVTIEGCTELRNKGKQLTYADFHPILRNLSPEGPLVLTAGTGSLTFPVETPGDLLRLRIGTSYRARDAKDGWTISASFD